MPQHMLPDVLLATEALHPLLTQNNFSICTHPRDGDQPAFLACQVPRARKPEAQQGSAHHRLCLPLPV